MTIAEAVGGDALKAHKIRWRRSSLTATHTHDAAAFAAGQLAPSPLMTGVTAVIRRTGHPEGPFNTMTESDLDDARRADVALDVRPLFATVGAGLSARGSY